MAKAKVRTTVHQDNMLEYIEPKNGAELDKLLEQVQVESTAFLLKRSLAWIIDLMEREVQFKAGQMDSRGTPADRWGSQRGYVIVENQRVEVNRPRLRRRVGCTKGTREIPIDSYRAFQARGPRSEAIVRALARGMSTRDYKGSVRKIAGTYGISKSVASREFIEATAKDLEAFCERRLDDIHMVALMIDAVTLGGTKFVTALVIDRLGYKHIAGFREGATENAMVTADLLEDLKRRGLRLNGPVLVVLDGAKALRAAVDAVFGDRALVQRCQEHKVRNVLSYLSDAHKVPIGRRIRNAYRSFRYADAKLALERLARELDTLNPDAAGSLREGLEETLTVHRLELPPILRSTLRTTNPVESPFSQSRHVLKNVRRWRNSNQKRRWLALAAFKAEKSFRRIKGYASMPVLEAALSGMTGTDISAQQNAA